MKKQRNSLFFKRIGKCLICLLFIISCFNFSSCHKAVKFDIRFFVDGKIYSMTSSSGNEKIILPKNPEKDGYSFDGWYCDNKIWEKPFTADSLLNVSLTSDMSIWAKFTEIHKHTYNDEWSYDDENHWRDCECGEQSYFSGHEFGDWQVETPATENSVGTEKRICSVCGFSQTREIPKLTHKHIYDKEVVAEKYLKQKANCTTPAIYFKSCECGEIGTDTFSVGDVEHDYTIEVIKPTCENKGYTKYTCKHCENGYITDETKALGHNFEWIVDEYETFSSTGLKHEECSVCHQKRNENTIIPVKICNHENTTYFKQLDATCTENGTKEYWYCKDCKKYFSDETCQNEIENIETWKIISAINHEYINGVCKHCSEYEIYTATFMAENKLVKTIEFTVATKSLEEPKVPDKTGYTGKWNSYTLINENIVINAIYELNEYKITYELFGAENNKNNPTSFTIKDGNLKLYQLEDSFGKSFDGWYTSQTFEPETKISSINSGVAKDLVLYAKFINYRIESANGFEFDYTDLDLPVLTLTTPSSKTSITLSNIIKVSDGCSWTLSTDIEGRDNISTKSLSLNLGHNIAYIMVKYSDDYSKIYKIDIYRLSKKTYKFISESAVYIEETEVEEFTLIEKPKDPTKEGYVFVGWTEDLTSEEITLVKFPYELKENKIFYAVYSNSYFVVTYNVNGGDKFEVETQNCYYDMSVTLKIPTRTGYTFDGWYYGETLVESGIWKYSENLTLVAHWSPITYTITYSLNGGEVTNVTTYNIETETFTLNNPTKTGYTFIGWTGSNGNEKQTTVTIQKGSTENKSYTANWQANSYIITFDANSGNINQTTMTVLYDSNYSLPTATKVGYTFIGWYYNSTKIENGKWNFINNIEVVAHWKNNKYEITYNNVAEGKPTITVTFNYNYENSTNESVELYDGETLQCPTNPTREGYIFSGWYTDIYCKNIYLFDKPITENMTLYADWSNVTLTNDSTYPWIVGNGTLNSTNTDAGTNSKYTITANSSVKVSFECKKYYCHDSDFFSVLKNGKSISFAYSSSCVELEKGDYLSFVFSKQYSRYYYASSCTIYISNLSISSNVKYESTAKVVKSNVLNYKYSTSSTIVKETEYDTEFELIEPYRMGYTFTGWYDGSIKIENGIWNYAKDLTLNSKWELCNYTITYNLNGGNSKNPTSYNILTKTFVLTDPKRTGYTFIGWTGSNGEIPQTSVTISKNDTGNKTFTANWEIITYKIDYELDDGINNESNPNSYTVENSTIILKDAEKEFYTFDGWYTSNTFEESTRIYSIDTMIANDLIIYAKFTETEPLKYKLSEDKTHYIVVGYFDGITNVEIKSIINDLPVTEIGNNAFYDCNTLTSVIIPNSITNIGDSAFYGCDSLTSVNIPNSVINIGSGVFNGLKNITIPKSVVTIGNLFSYNPINIYYTGTLYDWCKITFLSNFTSCEKSLYIKNTNGIFEEITELVIPNDVTEIKDYAFGGFNYITKIIVHNNVTRIGSSAFGGCTSLSYLSIPFTGESKTSNRFFGYIFGASEYSKNSSYIPSSLKEVVLTNETVIVNYAFYKCGNITTINLGDKLTFIGNYAFLDCCGLTKMTIPNSVNEIGYEIFYGCKYLEYLTIPFIGETQQSNNIFGYYFEYNYNSGSYIYPYSLENVTITNATLIKENAFKNCSNIKSITINTGVTKIESNAFCCCSELQTISLPESVVNIGSYAFYGCSSLTNVTLPSKITNISYSEFENCTSLVGVNILGDISTISGEAFAGCTKLKTITVPDSLTTIESSAFYNCSSFENITLSSSIKNIGKEAFYGCNKLKYTTYDNAKYLGNDTNLYLALITATNLNITSCKVNDNTKIIADSAFNNCTCLTNVIIGNNVIKIGNYVFNNCQNLTSVTMGNSVTCISCGMFSNCSSLKNITIPETVTSVEDSAFLNCTSLTTIVIPNSVKNIGSCIFSDCNNLVSITIPFVGKNKTNSKKLGYMFNYDNSNSKIQSSLKEVILTNETKINRYTFSDCSSITTVSINNGVTSIEYQAFYYCNSLTKIILPESLLSIEGSAFYYCGMMENIQIPNSVTSINGSAFTGCSRLSYNIYDNAKYLGNGENSYFALIELVDKNITSCEINENTKVIASGAFSNCANLENIIIPNGVKIIDGTFSNCSSLVSVTLPESITSIGYNAFYNCTNLKNITIPNNVTNIGNSAFYGCDNLKNITIPSSVTNIGNSAFCNCNNLSYNIYDNAKYLGNSKNSYFALVEIVNKDMTSCEINENTKVIANETFSYCLNLETIIIPSGITKISYSLFNNCSSLTSVTLPNTITTIESYAFKDCVNLTNINLPENLISIETQAFYDCYKLKEITLPNGLKSIGDYAFNNCNNLITITIPNSVTDIGEYTFKYCSNLTNIVIGNGITIIGNNSFSNCSNLENVYYNGTINEWYNITFVSSTSNPTYYGKHFYVLNDDGKYVEII